MKHWIWFFLFPSFASAASFTPMGFISLEFGGDRLVDVAYSDGSRASLEAGRGVNCGGGVLFPWRESLDVQSTVGVKWTTVKEATNGTVDWLRLPLELLVFYKVPQWRLRVGAGPTLHLMNDLRGTQDAAVVSQSFESAIGLTFEADYVFGEKNEMALGFRMTSITYTAKDLNASARGDGAGVSFAYFLY